MSARLEAIFLRPSSRTPVKSVAQALARPGGLEGDHGGGSRRQVTLLAREDWEAACRELGQEIDPSVRRANLLVSGIDLRAQRGRKLRIGAAELEVLGELAPCKLMDDTARGLMDALRPDWRGGVYARVTGEGTLQVGDAVDAGSSDD